MLAKRMPKDGVIGIFCPSHVAEEARYASIAAALRRHGFKVKFGENIYKDTYGYAASARERADDLNALVADDSVHMIFFSGGSGAVEILPYIDYDNIQTRPKLFCSYSDGTSILNAIYAQTGLITYHGMSVSNFVDLRHYDYTQFCSHFIEGNVAERFASDSDWKTLRGGCCEGTLIGGYISLFALMLTNRYFQYNPDEKYILFLEDHEQFSNEVGIVSTYLAFIGQSAFAGNIAGLIFGHYSINVPEDLLRCLERFGAEHDIPVIYTDDFGHGTKHAIFPIGMSAKLNADEQSLVFGENK